MSQAAPQHPRQLPAPFGRYRLLKLLGEGGMGAVYLAHDEQLDRPVALKIPNLEAGEGSQVLTRFYREARAAAALRHPNICPVYEVGEVEGVPYLAMAFLDGKPLSDLIATGRLPTQRQSAVLLRKLALALAEAHRCGVVHRDLKPGNVMIDRRGEPIILDFGLARRNRPDEVRVTQKGSALGTPAYMSPEQVQGKVDEMGPSCDIYALGVILYESLTGRLPFNAKDVMAMLSQVLLDEPPPPSRFRSDLDPALGAICLKAMAKKPADRYPSMTALATALQDYLRGAASTPEAPPPAYGLADVSERATPTPGIRATQMGGLRSVAQFHAERATPPIKESRPPRKRRKKGRGRSPAVWLWAAGGVSVALLLLAGGGWMLYRMARPGPASARAAAQAEPSPAGAAGPQVPTPRPVTQDDRPAPRPVVKDDPPPSRPAAKDDPPPPRSAVKDDGPSPSPAVPVGTVNILTEEEKAAGWRLLFDGRTTAGWRGYNVSAVPDTWRVEDGKLVFVPQAGVRSPDLMTLDKYDDFDLVFDWKITPGGNSGVMYRVVEGPDKPYRSGPEYQIVDDAANPERRFPKTWTSACYGLYAPSRDATRPVGEWNQGRIIVVGNQVQHWLNGERMVAYELGSAEWRVLVRASMFKNQPLYGKARAGHIDLQAQAGRVEFRNLKVRPLKGAGRQ